LIYFFKKTSLDHCNLEHTKISQNKTPGDSKVTSSLGFSSKNLLEFNVVKKKLKIKHENKHNLHRQYGTF